MCKTLLAQCLARKESMRMEVYHTVAPRAGLEPASLPTDRFRDGSTTDCGNVACAELALCVCYFNNLFINMSASSFVCT